MKRKNIVLLSLAAVAFLVFYHFYGGSAVPTGQQPLVRLDSSNITSLRDAFNESGNSVRVLVLLSPT
jgi:hypothetical protein